MDDELLHAAQCKAVTRPLGLGCDTRGIVVLALVDRQSGDRLARDNAGEPALGLCRAFERADCPNGGREEGRRGEVPADFLKHQSCFDHAEPGAAVALPPP